MTERPTAQPLPADLGTAAAAALDKKAEDLVILDLRGLSNFTDWFLICNGRSSRQVQAIAGAVEENLGRGRRGSVEGLSQGEWVLMDFGEFIIHVFTPEKREFYNLERLWGDAPRVEKAAGEPTRRGRRTARAKA